MHGILKRVTLKHALFLVGVLILASAAFIAVKLADPYPFSAVEQNIEFKSKNVEPGEAIAHLRDAGSVVVATSFYESGTLNQYMATALTMWGVVLAGNGREFVSLTRVYSRTGQLLYCNTNDGELKVNRELTPAECLAVQGDATRFILEVDFPDTQLPRSQVLFDGNRIRLKPNHYSEVNRVAYVLAKKTFSNTDEIVERVNELGRQLMG